MCDSNDDGARRLSPGEGTERGAGTVKTRRGVGVTSIVSAAIAEDEQMALPLASLSGEVAGNALAESGITAAQDNADAWWYDGATRVIVAFAASGREFDVNDVRAAIGEHDGHPNAWGGPFRSAHRQGLIRPVSAVPSSRPTRHGSLVRRWVGTAIARNAS